jgi:MFS transporter, ACS family, tartrate transporter
MEQINAVGNHDAGAVPPVDALASETVRLIMRRLLPFLWLLYFVAYLDRVNVAYAALEMTRDLHFSDRVFGLGAGIFFIGYVLLEIPGAILVERWSARRWIARIMVSWGVATAFVGFVNSAHQFYGARFLLGAAEAGFFPGVVVYLTHWIPQENRARALGTLLTATSVANIFGAPLAGRILQVHWHGLQGWRWLFILEGIPAVVFGIVALFYLTDRPEHARWLSPAQATWIAQQLQREKDSKRALHRLTIWQALRHRHVLLLALIYFMGSTGVYGFVIWLPTILKRASGFSTGAVTLLAALPYVAALSGMFFNGWHSDLRQERRWHTALPLFAAGILLIAAVGFSAHFWTQFVLFILFAGFIHAYQTTFWSLPTAFLTESAAAASIGLINCVGGLGGFVGPFVVGHLVTRTGSFRGGLAWLWVNILLAGCLTLCLRRSEPRSSIMTPG